MLKTHKIDREILSILSRHPCGVTATVIAERSEYRFSVVQRHLQSMVEMGWIDCAVDKRYRLTAKMEQTSDQPYQRVGFCQLVGKVK